MHACVQKSQCYISLLDITHALAHTYLISEDHSMMGTPPPLPTHTPLYKNKKVRETQVNSEALQQDNLTDIL